MDREEMNSENMRSIPIALFMAFGTKGDVYPIAAIAAAFACDQEHYRAMLLTHSAHEDLKAPLAAKNVEYLSVSTPPVLSSYGDEGTLKPCFSLKKRRITKGHRQECISNVERVFGEGPSLGGDFIVINFFALEGWSLAEAFNIRCIIAAPYVVPYSAPSSFETHFKKELPFLYNYLKEAPVNKVGWKDVTHWMWPIFTEDWGSWRSTDLKLSPWPFTDPVTGLPMWHDRPPSPLLLYGFSKEVVECPGYWPMNVRVCGYWFLPSEWQFSCNNCGEISALFSQGHLTTEREMCSAHVNLQSFLSPSSSPPIFIGLSSIGSMGFLKIPEAFIGVLRIVLEIISHRLILFSSGYEPLDDIIRKVAAQSSPFPERKLCSKEEVSLFGGRLFCFSGSVPYEWLFPRCEVVVHHGGSGTTAAALRAGIPQVICPFMLDQFYWAERMHWLGVASEPLNRNQILPDKNDELCVKEAANMLAKAINYALTSKVKARALEIAERLSLEDGVLEAVKIIKEEIIQS